MNKNDLIKSNTLNSSEQAFRYSRAIKENWKEDEGRTQKAEEVYVPFRRSVKLNFIIVSSQKFLYLCFDLGYNLRNNISRTFTVLRAHHYGLRKALFLDFVCLVLMLLPGFLKCSFLVGECITIFLSYHPTKALTQEKRDK